MRSTTETYTSPASPAGGASLPPYHHPSLAAAGPFKSSPPQAFLPAPHFAAAGAPLFEPAHAHVMPLHLPPERTPMTTTTTRATPPPYAATTPSSPGGGGRHAQHSHLQQQHPHRAPLVPSASSSSAGGGGAAGRSSSQATSSTAGPSTVRRAPSGAGGGGGAGGSGEDIANRIVAFQRRQAGGPLSRRGGAREPMADDGAAARAREPAAGRSAQQQQQQGMAADHLESSTSSSSAFRPSRRGRSRADDAAAAAACSSDEDVYRREPAMGRAVYEPGVDSAMAIGAGGRHHRHAGRRVELVPPAEETEIEDEGGGGGGAGSDDGGGGGAHDDEDDFRRRRRRAGSERTTATKSQHSSGTAAAAAGGGGNRSQYSTGSGLIAGEALHRTISCGSRRLQLSQSAGAPGSSSMTTTGGGSMTGPYQGQGPMRKLFDPSMDDPLKFQKAPSVSTGSGSNTTFGGRTYASERSTGTGAGGSVLRKGSSLATSVSVGASSEKATAAAAAPSAGASAAGGRSLVGTSRLGSILADDDQGDRERERRRRREGSERGSQQRRTARDGESRGSRSSEGSESLKDRERRGKGAAGDTGIMSRLRESYKGIQALEASLNEMHRKMRQDPSSGVRILIQSGSLGQGDRAAPQVFNPTMGNGALSILRLAEEDEYARDMPRRSPQSTPAPLREDEAWAELVAKHKKLADAHHDFLSLSLDPLIPASLHSLPVKYNIPTRLWKTGFHDLLEGMRHVWLSNAPTPAHMVGHPSHGLRDVKQRDVKLSARVLDHLTDFIYDAYSFYTSLLEEQTLCNFKSAWIEALGDLARYRMAIAAAITGQEKLERKEAAEARIDDDDDDARPPPSGASIGAEVAESWNLEERETWRVTARDWYVMGLTEKPGEGRLHHHLALLCRDVKGDEGRALYHFTKSLATSHPYPTSRETIQPLFDAAIQQRRSAPDAQAAELFLLMHGMIFTRIELDNFEQVFARFLERLDEDRLGATGVKPITQVEWLTMAVVNVNAIMQYGAEDGFIRKALAEDSIARKVSRQPAEDQGELVSVLKKTTLAAPEADDLETYPLPFCSALRLAFKMFAYALKHPMKTIGLHTQLNPYIAVFLSFLATVLKQKSALSILERFLPWQAMVDFFNTIPRKVEVRLDANAKLTSGPPIPEDWCIRGLEWVGRRVYERGFWKAKSGSGGRGSGGPTQPRSGVRIQSEMDVLLSEQDQSQIELDEGIVDDHEDKDGVDSASAVTSRRWARIAWAAGTIASIVPGVSYDRPDKYHAFSIAPDGPLAEKVARWHAQEIAQRRSEIEARKREEEVKMASLPDEPDVEDVDEADTDDADLLALRERRRHLRSLLAMSNAKDGGETSRPARPTARAAARKQSLLPGYTVLVFDTNVLLSALDAVQTIVSSRQYTVVIPLPVITELDGLAKQPAPLGAAAAAAVTYLESNLRTSAISLKVQTAMGNYLSDLAIRAEDFSLATTGDYTVDDFILRVASFQAAHFVDRSAILGMQEGAEYESKKRSAVKTLLLTFDRNLRLRARARGVSAASKEELARVLGPSR